MKDNSELVQVSESLRVEIIAVRKQLQEAEVSSSCSLNIISLFVLFVAIVYVASLIYLCIQVSKQDIEDEKYIWKNEIDAEKENRSELQVPI